MYVHREPRETLRKEFLMSVSGILASALFQSHNLLPAKSGFQKFQQEFQQLGQDLQSGNLTQAQTDFAALQSTSSQPTSSAATQTCSSALSSAFNQLSQDLQAGNLTAAKQDYSTLQQGFQRQSPAVSTHPHHHHHHSSSSPDTSSSQNPIDQLFSQLGSALQSGNLPNAQSAYASLQQDFLQLGGSSAASPAASSTTAASSNPLNVSA
jgi:outer membrane protein assembly factor BamD (BamD/ComL family)